MKNVRKIKKIVVIGLGYVGLPTLVAIYKSGLYEVIGFDVDASKIKKIKSGICPINNIEVEDFIKRKILDVSSDKKKFVDSDVFIICVPTPILNDFIPDYSYIISASQIVAKYLKKGSHFVLESTVNPGTCEEIVLPVLEKISGLKAGRDFNIAHCPERINPGDKKWNIYNINRNIGSINKRLNKVIANFYNSFISEASINVVNSLKIAEATKIVENTFRDINIAFVNELAQSFDSLGIDLIETLKAASNKSFAFMAHWPGCGVGGHCIAVDPYYLIKRAGLNGFNHRFLKLAREINDGMPAYTVSRLIFALKKMDLPARGTKIALLGLSYKPDVGDLRESPALEIKKQLENLGADLVVYDPFVKETKSTLSLAIKNAVAIVIATAHTEIVAKLISRLKNSKVKVIIDGRNCMDGKKIEKMGIIYYGIGR